MRSCDIRSFHPRGHKTCKTRGSAEGFTGFCDPEGGMNVYHMNAYKRVFFSHTYTEKTEIFFKDCESLPPYWKIFTSVI